MALDQFLEALGATDFLPKIKEENADIKAIATEFAERYGATLLERKGAELRETGKREGQLATYSILEQKIAETFSEYLNPDEFKDVKSGKTEAMLKALKAKTQDQIKAAKAEGKNADAVKLQEQLEAVNAELKDYKAKAEQLPTLLEQERQKIKAEYFVENQLEKALGKLENAIVDKDVIRAYVQNVAKLEAVADDKGNMKLVIRNNQGELFNKSATQNYSDLYDFLDKEIMVKKNLYKRHEGGSNPAPNPAPNNQGNQGGGLHPNFKGFGGVK